MFNLSKLFAPNPQDTDSNSGLDTVDSSSSDIKNFLGSAGAEATVDEIIEGPGKKKGRVYFQGTWWPAACTLEAVLNPGEVVKVVGMDRITLLVEPFIDGE